MGLFGFGKKKEQPQEQAPVRPQSTPVMAPVEEPAPEPKEEKGGVFSRLWRGLTKTRNNVDGKVDEIV